MRRLIKMTAVALLAGSVQGCVSFHVAEDNWFHPQASELDDGMLAAMALPAGYAAERVSFNAADGTRLAALHVRGDGRRPTVFYLGGDSFRIPEQGLEIAAQLAALGVNVFMMDYRGYGGSQGSPSIKGLMADAEAGLALLRQRVHGGAQTVVVHGFSMGSFIAAELATRSEIEGLILESTATSVRDWADHQVPWYGKPFVFIDLAEPLESQNNIARVQKYSGPLLLIAGGSDAKTPAGMSHDLFAVSATPRACRRLLEVEAAGHGDALTHKAAREGYREFMALAMQCMQRTVAEGNGQ
ncbi:MAG TPA: alpha/beta fold hydrolase [Gammaproteobacteria bacterium]